MDDLKKLLEALPPEELAYFTERMREERDSCVRLKRPALGDAFNACTILGSNERQRRDDPRRLREENLELLRIYAGADAFQPGTFGWVEK
ncbi:MAG: hypothetical protein HY821_13175 [Acidobacteria bacterium]|nr:hypothetical protein [Acidobacteriota bacterium]